MTKRRSRSLLPPAWVALAIVVLCVGCTRKKPPRAVHLWLGPSGGCIETESHPTTGTFACWGNNDAGQLGDGTTEARHVATRSPLGGGRPTRLALGRRHACGVFDRANVRCWGEGHHGQLGSDVRTSLVPVDVRAAKGVEELGVGVGGSHTCVREGTGRLRCFGANDEGQLGGPNDWERRDARVGAFALGAAHTCAELRDDAGTSKGVVCRGRAEASPREPVLVGSRLVALVAGDAHTCALVVGGLVECWGSNRVGQLGNGSTTASVTPVRVKGLANVLEVAAGSNHTCARLSDGTVACWGDNRERQLAHPNLDESAQPLLVMGMLGVRELAAGGGGTCVRLEGGAVRCWGANSEGQLGDGTQEAHPVPAQVRFH